MPPPDDGRRFRELFLEELPRLNPTSHPARLPLFSGKWECIWTSKQELNFLVRSDLLGDK